MFDIEFYVTPEGRNLYREWMQQLRDQTMRVAADRRIARVRSGNFGDRKYCQNGIWELRIALGPGLRIYYGLQGESTAIVICAGDKSTQSADIRRAVAIWKQISLEQKEKTGEPNNPI